MSENVVVKAVCEYLEAKRYFFWRQNNVGVFDPVRKIHRKMPKWARKGVPDVMALVNGIPYYIECKLNTKQSKEQKEFEADVVKNGGVYILARSSDDLREHGL